MPTNSQDDEDTSRPLEVGRDKLPFDDHEIGKVAAGIKKLMMLPPRPLAVGLPERMAGQVSSGMNQTKDAAPLPKNIDLSRFDQTLRNTLRR